MIIETERLYLRPISAGDAAALYAIYGDPLTNLFNPAGPYPSLNFAQTILADWMEQWTLHGFGHWAISQRSAPADIIGFGGLSRRKVDEIRNINLGYRFSTSVWGKGLATEFARASLVFGFDQLKLWEISALVRENHLASRHVLEKIGMRVVGEISDVESGGGSVIYTLHKTGPRNRMNE